MASLAKSLMAARRQGRRCFGKDLLRPSGDVASGTVEILGRTLRDLENGVLGRGVDEGKGPATGSVGSKRAPKISQLQKCAGQGCGDWGVEKPRFFPSPFR